MSGMKEFLFGSAPNWYEQAACARPDLDPALWDGEAKAGGRFTRDDIRDIELAISICNKECPVREACLIDALENKIEYTIRGGYMPKQRARILAIVPADQWSGMAKSDGKAK